jgi:hypothetical protein
MGRRCALLVALCVAAPGAAPAQDAECLRNCDAEHVLCRSRAADPLALAPDPRHCQELYLRCLGERQLKEKSLFHCMEVQAQCEQRQAEQTERKRESRLQRCEEKLSGCGRRCPP